LTEHQQVQEKENALRQTFLDKKALAVNLPAYRQQMEEMQQTFGTLLRQLPNKTEVPNLLVDITQAGLGRGLNFVLFKPEKEKPLEFYAELPINIIVTGGYHQLGEFVSDIAALPRIVTVSNINISAPRRARGSPCRRWRVPSAISNRKRLRRSSRRLRQGPQIMRRNLVVLLSALLVAGCTSDGLDDLREFVKTAHADKKPRIEPLPEVRPYEAYAYAASDLADPFAPRICDRRWPRARAAVRGRT